MNYYNEIKTKLLNNEVYEKVKDYSKERHRVLTYFEIERLLHEAGKHYGENIIKKYSIKLSQELNEKYGERLLRNMRRFYVIFNGNDFSVENINNQDNSIWHTVCAKSQGPSIKTKNDYILSSMQKVSTAFQLPNTNSKNLLNLTWSHYVRLIALNDFYKIIYYTRVAISQQLSVRQLEAKIKSKEYERLDEKTRIKLINNDSNALNIKDYVPNPIYIKNNSNIDNNIKSIEDDNTIGIIIVKRNNNFYLEYVSDERVISREYRVV